MRTPKATTLESTPVSDSNRELIYPSTLSFLRQGVFLWRSGRKVSFIKTTMAWDDEVNTWARENGVFADHRFFKTSGSSGIEKWIALSNEALEWSARSVVDFLDIGAGDVLGLALPEYHVGGYGVGLRARVSGAKLAGFDKKWNAENFAEWTDERGVTVASLVPTQVYDLVLAGVRGGKFLRSIVVGGGAFDPDLCEQARGLGWPVLPSYGMTETSSQVATGDGLPLLPGWQARIEDGCLALKGGGLLSAVITRRGVGFVSHDPKIDGWFVTNDRAELTPEGLRILGRADRVVKVSGELVDLEMLEDFWRNVLKAEVALLAMPGGRRGMSLKLFHEETSAEVELINASLPGPERLESWKEVELLPRSAIGKLDRSALRKFHAD